jgi:hypothetical protein
MLFFLFLKISAANQFNLLQKWRNSQHCYFLYWFTLKPLELFDCNKLFLPNSHMRKYNMHAPHGALPKTEKDFMPTFFVFLTFLQTNLPHQKQNPFFNRYCMRVNLPHQKILLLTDTAMSKHTDQNQISQCTLQYEIKEGGWLP